MTGLRPTILLFALLTPLCGFAAPPAATDSAPFDAAVRSRELNSRRAGALDE